MCSLNFFAEEKSITHPAIEEAKKISLDVQSTFLDISHSTTGGHVPYNAPYLRGAESTTSAAHVEAHLLAAQVQQFTYRHHIIRQSA
jgi:hypothetical protein